MSMSLQMRTAYAQSCNFGYKVLDRSCGMVASQIAAPFMQSGLALIGHLKKDPGQSARSLTAQLMIQPWALYACIYLHEIGHALAGKISGTSLGCQEIKVSWNFRGWVHLHHADMIFFKSYLFSYNEDAALCFEIAGGPLMDQLVIFSATALANMYHQKRPELARTLALAGVIRAVTVINYSRMPIGDYTKLSECFQINQSLLTVAVLIASMRSVKKISTIMMNRNSIATIMCTVGLVFVAKILHPFDARGNPV